MSDVALVAKAIKCPDCGGSMRLSDPSKGVYWCSPCKRARDGIHMEKFVAPVKTFDAKFKRLADDPQQQLKGPIS